MAQHQVSSRQRPALGRWSSFRVTQQHNKKHKNEHCRQETPASRPKTRSLDRPQRRNSFVRVDRAMTTSTISGGGMIISSSSITTTYQPYNFEEFGEYDAPRKPLSLPSLKLPKRSSSLGKKTPEKKSKPAVITNDYYGYEEHTPSRQSSTSSLKVPKRSTSKRKTSKSKSVTANDYHGYEDHAPPRLASVPSPKEQKRSTSTSKDKKSKSRTTTTTFTNHEYEYEDCSPQKPSPTSNLVSKRAASKKKEEKNSTTTTTTTTTIQPHLNYGHKEAESKLSSSPYLQLESTNRAPRKSLSKKSLSFRGVPERMVTLQERSPNQPRSSRRSLGERSKSLRVLSGSFRNLFGEENKSSREKTKTCQQLRRLSSLRRIVTGNKPVKECEESQSPPVRRKIIVRLQ